MRVLSRLVIFLIASVLLVSSSGAFAAPRAASIRERMDMAVQAQQADRHADAVRLFEALEADFPKGRAKIAFYRARSLLALERYEDARGIYRELAAAATLDDEKQVEVRKNLLLCDEALRTTHVRVMISGASAAALFVDGELRGRLPQTLELRKGSYRLAAEEAGYARVEREVMVTGQPSLEVTLAMVPLSIAMDPAQGLPGSSVALDGSQGTQVASGARRTWAWVALGTGVATLAGGAGMLGHYFAKKGQVREGEMLQNESVDLGVGGTLTAVGVGFVTTGLVLLFGGESSSSAPVVGVSPLSGGVTGVVVGRW